MDEQLLQALMLRAPEAGATGNFDPLMREAIRLQNEAARRSVQRPDTSGYATAGFQREMQGMNDVAAGMAMATSVPQFAQLAQQTHKAGLEAQQPMEMGEGLYMPGTGYVPDPFKQQDRLSKALATQGASAAHYATAYGTQEHQRNVEQNAKLQLENQLRHQRATEAQGAGHLALARQQAELGKIMQVEDANGNKTLVRIHMTPQGPVQIPVGGPGGAAPGGAPSFAPGTTTPIPANLKEPQAKAAGYALRAIEADRLLETIGTKYSPSSVSFKGGLEHVKGIGGALGSGYNFLMGPAEQQVEQAQRDFINAILRPESGAVINPDEFVNARQQYFPQPGDSPEVLAQKRQNRALKIQGLMIEAGPAGTRYLQQQQQPAGAAPGAPAAPAAPASPGARSVNVYGFPNARL